MQKIKETIKSAVGFYIGDAKRIASIIHGPYIANNDPIFDVETNRFILLPLELAPTVDKLTSTGGIVCFGRGEATLEADENFIKITLPNTEVVEIYKGRSRK